MIPIPTILDSYTPTIANRIALDLLKQFAPVNMVKPHNIFVLTNPSRSGLSFYCRVFVPAIVNSDPAIVELTYAIARATGHSHKTIGNEIWLAFKGSFDKSLPGELLALAHNVEPELRALAYRVNPL